MRTPKGFAATKELTIDFDQWETLVLKTPKGPMVVVSRRKHRLFDTPQPVALFQCRAKQVVWLMSEAGQSLCFGEIADEDDIGRIVRHHGCDVAR